MSDFPEPPQNTFVNPQMVEKRGMSGGTKVLLILGIVFLVCVLVCCGGVIIATFFVGKAVQDMVTTDPVEVARRQADTIDIEIPEVFTPQSSIDMAFAGTRLMIMVIYQGQAPGDSLALVGIGDMLADQPQAQMERQIQDSLQQQGVGQPDPGTKWEMEPKEFTIGGKTVEFLYRTEKNENDEPVRYHVTGTVTGKQGPVYVVLSVSAEKMSEEEIDGMIKSIK